MNSFKSRTDIIRFILAGNARITIRSKVTGNRFTFRVRQPSETSPHFVSVLVGPDNQSDYVFLGSILESKDWRHGKKSVITCNAVSAKAFVWFWNQLISGNLPASVEVFHEGMCGKCGRSLTVPESIKSGIGPECVKKMR